MGFIIGLVLGIMAGVWICVDAYTKNEAPIIQAKHECERTLPRNMECVWVAPPIDRELPAASGEECSGERRLSGNQGRRKGESNDNTAFERAHRVRPRGVGVA
jgi:hypothetical protein